MPDNLPEFERAQYAEPVTIEGNPIEPAGAGAFPKALLFGIVGAIVGGAGYGLVGLSGWMVSIVAIGVGWLVGRAMMTGSNGTGGRTYQVAAALLTYLACSGGDLIDLLHRSGIPLAETFKVPAGQLLRYLLLGPFLDLRNAFNGIIGLFILFIGMRAAWKIAAGTPGFGRSGGARINPFGVR